MTTQQAINKIRNNTLRMKENTDNTYSLESACENEITLIENELKRYEKATLNYKHLIAKLYNKETLNQAEIAVIERLIK